MSRLKNPAYGKQLLDDRRAGHHPLEITLAYGDRWSKAKDPKIGIDPEEYQPGKYDLCMLAGARVIVLDQLNGACDLNGKFYDLVREIAIAGGLVVVKSPDGQMVSALELAERERRLSADGETWPRWWSKPLDDAQRRLMYDWLADKRNAPNGRAAA